MEHDRFCEAEHCDGWCLCDERGALSRKSQSTGSVSWRKCRPGIIRRVDFALYSANVELVECLDYFNGRIYHVRDPKNGRFDFVGSEYLMKPNDLVEPEKTRK